MSQMGEMAALEAASRRWRWGSSHVSAAPIVGDCSRPRSLHQVPTDASSAVFDRCFRGKTFNKVPGTSLSPPRRTTHMKNDTSSLLLEVTKLVLAKIPDSLVAGLAIASAVVAGTWLLLRTVL